MTEQPHEPYREHRKYPRSKVGIQVELKTEGAAMPSRTETADLSLGGCYIEMSFTLQVGTKLDLVLWVDDQPLATKAVVVTHHPQFGNGMEFHNMSEEDKAKLERFMKRCEAQTEQKPEAKASGQGN
jgi:c-di-GMP-binding flagellar brake protein YcgR